MRHSTFSGDGQRGAKLGAHIVCVSTDGCARGGRMTLTLYCAVPVGQRRTLPAPSSICHNLQNPVTEPAPFSSGVREVSFHDRIQ